jgi:hypothetical protein
MVARGPPAWEECYDAFVPHPSARLGNLHGPPGLITPLAALLFVVTTAFLVWPLYPWLGNSIEPRVLGMPWSLVYVLLVIAVNAVALVTLYLTRVVDAEEHPEDAGG